MSTNTTNLADGILEWWHIVIFAASTFIGFILGTAKQRWTQEQLAIRVGALEARLLALEHNTNSDSRAMLVMATEMTHIKSALEEIKRKLEE